MKTFTSMLVMLALVILHHHEAPGQSNNARRSKTGSGSICIAEVTPPAAGETRWGNPRGERASTYSIQVDQRASVDAPSNGAVRIAGLSVGKKHLVRIYGDGVLKESFRFRFESFDTKELCLWFNSLYGTWSLWDAKDGGSKCRCGTSGRRGAA
jgi:hypothetical protein